MSYRIAIASNDGININEHFGSAKYFLIVEVDDKGNYVNKENRIIEESSIKSNCGSGCNNGCGGKGDFATSYRVSLISDCRALLCKKIGTNFEKQLGRKGIISYQIDNSIEEALKIIIEYYRKVDNHISLRNSRK
ncbi:MAG: hydrogenase [Clostridiales bacterium]|nr:hydrogenase [Clostridiales bacterium]